MNSRALSAVAAAICLAAMLPVALAQTRGDQEKMNLEKNKVIVRDYLNEIVNKGNIAAFSDYFFEDVVFNNARGFKQRFPAIRQAMLVAFPDHHLTIEDQVAEDLLQLLLVAQHRGRAEGIVS